MICDHVYPNSWTESGPHIRCIKCDEPVNGAPHTRESDLHETLVEELRKAGFGPGWCKYIVSPDYKHQNRDQESDKRLVEACLAAMRRVSTQEPVIKCDGCGLWYDTRANDLSKCPSCISTPIPLTPSDEMVEAALNSLPRCVTPIYRQYMKNALQAALNLMGGDK